MKYILILALFVAFFAQAEKYYVIYAKGNIHIAGSGKPLKTGDVIEPSQKLIFDSPSSKLVCMSPEKGRVELGPGTTKSPSGELWAFMKSNVVPVVSHYRFSTRGLGFEGYDPATYFQSAQTDDRILLICDQVIPVSKSYQLDSADFFFVQYAVNGKQVTKKVDQSATGISFNWQTFSATSINGLPNTVMLCYQSAATSRQVATFKPVLITKTALEDQVAIIKTHSKAATKENIETYLYDTYGKIGEAELNDLLK